MNMGTEIVLVTGGNGFLGQHIIRELQLHDPRVCEIRVLDLVFYKNKLGHEDLKPLQSYVGDITKCESCREAFRGVHCVIHCAAQVNYSYPVNQNVIECCNVEGTQHVIQLCLEEGVARLVFCSTAEVVLQPRLLGTFPLIVGQNEIRALPPINLTSLQPYVASKLRAEKMVLSADRTPLHNNKGTLYTTALRPSMLYGELEPHFLSGLMNAACWMGGKFFAPTSPGGLQQFTYAGNAAWAHILAKDALLENVDNVSGLPIFVTDDTRVEHGYDFAARILGTNVRASFWLPTIITWPIAKLLETVVSLMNIELPLRPTALISFLGGIILYGRLRAALHLKYTPRYSETEAISNTKCYFTQLLK